MKSLFNTFAVLVLFAWCVPQTVSGHKAAYLMVYFKEHGHNVYFAVSRDGRTFTDVNGGEPVMTGDTLAEQKGIRDPHLMRGPDGAFYLAMTDLHIYAKQEGLRDTEWEPMLMYFDFSSIREHHRQVQADMAFLVGYETKFRLYFLGGPRLGYVFYQPTSVTSVVTTRGRYDEFIGIDGDGLFENMPDHFFDTQKRTYATRYLPAPKMSVSLEAGYRFPLNSRTPYSRFSLAVALFADYGMLFTGDNRTDIKAATYPNDPVKPEFYPYANPFLYRGVDNSFVGNALVGIKLTFLFSASRSFPCFCL